MIGHVRQKQGFALVLTLVVTALMVAVVAELIHQVYVDTALSRGFRDTQQASLLAESGVTGGSKLLQLALQAHSGYSSLSDQWATPFKLDDETGSIEIRITEESGRINLNDLVGGNNQINKDTLDILTRLGKQLQVPEGCWAALADWIDTNDETRSGGAESAYYRSLKTPYSARNGKLANLTELSLVKGFTPEIIAKLRPFVTIYAGQPTEFFATVNVNTAPKEVLMALNDSIDSRMADQIIEQRRLQPFQNNGELTSRVPGGASLIAAGGRVDFKGYVYRITSLARVNESVRTIEAVIRPGSAVLSWQEF